MKLQKKVFNGKEGICLQHRFKDYMNYVTSIRPILAGLMLCIFSLALTPKRFLHNLVAAHNDSYSKSAENNSPHIAKAGFNCSCDNIVATSPFDEVDDTLELKFPLFIVAHHQGFSYPYIYSTHYFFKLRGPPRPDSIS